MTARDELGALINAALDDFDEFYGPGIYATGERILTEILARWELVPRSILGPGLDGAVREYFEHGFNDQVILAAFPQLTAQQLATLRSTDRHGRTHPDYHGD